MCGQAVSPCLKSHSRAAVRKRRGEAVALGSGPVLGIGSQCKACFSGCSQPVQWRRPYSRPAAQVG